MGKNIYLWPFKFCIFCIFALHVSWARPFVASQSDHYRRLFSGTLGMLPVVLPNQHLPVTIVHFVWYSPTNMPPPATPCVCPDTLYLHTRGYWDTLHPGSDGGFVLIELWRLPAISLTSDTMCGSLAHYWDNSGDDGDISQQQEPGDRDTTPHHRRSWPYSRRWKRSRVAYPI